MKSYDWSAQYTSKNFDVQKKLLYTIFFHNFFMRQECDVQTAGTSYTLLLQEPPH